MCCANRALSNLTPLHGSTSEAGTVSPPLEGSAAVRGLGPAKRSTAGTMPIRHICSITLESLVNVFTNCVSHGASESLAKWLVGDVERASAAKWPAGDATEALVAK